MKTAEELKKVVQEKYSEIASQNKSVNAASCCGATTASGKIYNIMTDSYDTIEGYDPDADLGLGCGLPTSFAKIQPGDTVVDLGSGAGNDCFVARHETTESGKVIGIDFTASMIQKARENAEKLGYNNVEFRHGDIDDLPISDNSVDVVVSNCVLNLVPDKLKVIREIFRVLKPGGHFSISDIVLIGDLPEALQKDAEMYAGCIAGAIQKEEYLGYLRSTAFEEITVQKEKTITIPEDILERYLSTNEIVEFQSGNTGIFSITVYANKPGISERKSKQKAVEAATCQPGSGCC